MTLEYIFGKYYSVIVSYVNKIVKNKQDAEEITGNVFVKAWQYIDSIENEQKAKAFLYIAAKNLSINKLKYREYHKNENFDLDDDFDIVDLPIEIPYEDLLINIKWAINKLPTDQRAVINAIVKDGMTNAEIAVKLNKKEKTVRSLKSIALQKIKKYINATQSN